MPESCYIGGAIGKQPTGQPVDTELLINTQGRLITEDEFGSVIVKVGPGGERVQLRDVARVELGSETYTTYARYNGKPASGMAIRPASGANALKTVEAVKKKVAELERFFPPGVKAIFPYDTTPFVRISVQEVVKTLLEAIASSLTELFSPQIISERIDGMLKSYDFVTAETLAYFSQRPPLAERDSRFALDYVKRHARTPDEQQLVLAALEFKCDVLWAMLDALYHAYVAPGHIPPGAFAPKE